MADEEAMVRMGLMETTEQMAIPEEQAEPVEPVA
jgi:hypothetical protein